MCMADSKVKRLAVDEVPDSGARSDPVCMKPITKLEAINDFEVDGVYLHLDVEKLVSTVHFQKSCTWTQVFFSPSLTSHTVIYERISDDSHCV